MTTLKERYVNDGVMVTPVEVHERTRQRRLSVATIRPVSYQDWVLVPLLINGGHCYHYEQRTFRENHLRVFGRAPTEYEKDDANKKHGIGRHYLDDTTVKERSLARRKQRDALRYDPEKRRMWYLRDQQKKLRRPSKWER